MRQVLISLAVTSLVLAVPRPQSQAEEYNNSNGCWVPDVQMFIPIGATVPSPRLCEGYRCTSYGVVIEACPLVIVSPPCFVTVNEFQPYPGCCMMGVCPTTGDQPTQS